MKRRTVLIGAGGLAVLALLAILLTGNDAKNQTPEAGIPSLSADAFARIEDFTYTSNRDGRTEWEAHSEAAEWFQEKKLALFENGAVKFFAADGRVLGLLAEKGELNTEAKNVRVEGNVIATSDDGYRLLTNSLRYDSTDGVVSTDDPILFFGNQISLSGTGLKLDVDGERLTLLGPVEGMIWGVTDRGSRVGFGGLF